MIHRKKPWLVLGPIVIVLALAGLYGLRDFQSPGIVGTWHGDMTAAFNKAYTDPRIAIQDARSIVTFNSDGTYSSEDAAIFVAVSGPHKGNRANYRGWSRGTFAFHDGKGTTQEVTGEGMVGSVKMPVTLPQTVTLQLHGKSSLVIVEDYGARGRLQYALER